MKQKHLELIKISKMGLQFPLLNKLKYWVGLYLWLRKIMQICQIIVFFLYIKIKNKLLNAPKKITILQTKKLKSKLKKKYTKLTENNWPIIPIHLKLI